MKRINLILFSLGIVMVLLACEAINNSEGENTESNDSKGLSSYKQFRTSLIISTNLTRFVYASQFITRLQKKCGSQWYTDNYCYL